MNERVKSSLLYNKCAFQIMLNKQTIYSTTAAVVRFVWEVKESPLTPPL